MARLFLFPFLAALAGCVSTISTLDGRDLRLSSPEFRQYFERVFREQNAVATELAFVQGEAINRGDLLTLEDDLLDACAGLNELALARRDGRSLSRRRQASLARTVPTCETAVADVRSRLAESQVR